MASKCRLRLVPCVICQQQRTAESIQGHIEVHLEDSCEEVARLKKNLLAAEQRKRIVETAYASFLKLEKP
jgi:hypothetical protein